MKEKKKQKKKTWNYPKRLFYLFLFCIVLLYIQFGYLTLSSTVYGKDMDAFARNRDTARSVLMAKRGTIYDVEGNVLAQNVTSYTVIAYLDSSRTSDPEYPQHVVDKEKTAEVLAPVLSMEKETLLRLLSTENVYQVELGPGGRGISELKKEEVENLGLDGIDFIENTKRYYPNGDFASYLVGYAKSYPIKIDAKTGEELSDEEIEERKQTEEGFKFRNTQKIVGELGIELAYNEEITGTNGFLVYQRDKNGYQIPDTAEERKEAINGDDIYLTIDSAIQRFVEGTLKEYTEIYTPEWMLVAVMDAKTGDILASSSTPSFDPNVRNIVNYENPLTSYIFEPGSTMKTYTYMCAIDKGTYNGSYEYLSGTYTIGEDIIQDWNGGKGWGTINLDLGYEYSSNVGAVTIVNEFISRNELRSCLTKFGFGQITNIELPREMPGSINFTYPVEVAAAAYGQGITTTAVQHLQGLSIIANDGKMVTPHIISKIVDTNTGEVKKERKIEISEQLVRPETAQKVKQLMYNTVHNRNPSTTGIDYDIEGFNVIGKTGTAQIYDSVNGGYLKGRNDYIHSFAGMYPYEDPEIIIYVAAKKPAYGQGAVVSKVTTEIMKSIAKYRNMFNEKENLEDTTKYNMPALTNKNVIDAKEELSLKGMNVIIIGNGDKVISTYPSSNSTILKNDKVFLITNGSTWIMENLIGWSRIDATNYLRLVGLTVKTTGYGYVENQSIAPGTEIISGTEILLTLADKYNFDVQEPTENPESTG